MKFLSLAFVLGLLALASGEFTYIEIPPKKRYLEFLQLITNCFFSFCSFATETWQCDHQWRLQGLQCTWRQVRNDERPRKIQLLNSAAFYTTPICSL